MTNPRTVAEKIYDQIFEMNSDLPNILIHLIEQALIEQRDRALEEAANIACCCSGRIRLQKSTEKKT